MAQQTQDRSRDGGRVFGVILIVLGVMFLLGRLLEASLQNLPWPFFVMAPGLLLFLIGLLIGSQPGEGLAAVGSAALAVGVILYYQDQTQNWASWSYLWALVAPTSIGLGRAVFGLVRGKGEVLEDGLQMAGVGLVILLVLGAFFEYFMNPGAEPLIEGRLLWPILLIVLGVLLLLTQLVRGIWNREKT